MPDGAGGRLDGQVRGAGRHTLHGQMRDDGMIGDCFQTDIKGDIVPARPIIADQDGDGVGSGLNHCGERSKIEIAGFVSLSGYRFDGGFHFGSVQENPDGIKSAARVVGASGGEEEFLDVSGSGDKFLAEIIGRTQLGQAGDDVGRAAARAELGRPDGPRGIIEIGCKPVRRRGIGVVTPGGSEGDQGGPIGGSARRDLPEENVVHVERAAAGRRDGEVVAEFNVGKANGQLEGAIYVGPAGRACAGEEMSREVIRPGQGRAVVGVVAGFGGGPLKPMLGGLRDAGALEVAAKAVEGAGGDVESGVGDAILVVLADGVIVALVLEEHLHGLAALEDDIGAGEYVGHGERIVPPFVPVAVVVLFEAGV